MPSMLHNFRLGNRLSVSILDPIRKHHLQHTPTMSTPAEASNDQPFFLDIPSITFLSCSHSDPSSLDSSSGYTPIDIPFNYELFTTENVDVSLALEEFESALLGGVGEELGLMGCEERKMMRGENQVRRGLMKEPSVAGLSSEPVDEVIDGEWLCILLLIILFKISNNFLIIQ